MLAMATRNEHWTEIDKVTAEDIQRVAQDLIRTDALNLAVIGPFKDEERFAKLLSA